MKHTRHASSGLSLQMDFHDRPDGTAVIDVVHCGEYAVLGRKCHKPRL